MSWARRGFAAVVLLLLAGAWMSRGYCPMTVALNAAEGKTDSHDCCKTGLTGKTPSCCHVNDAANTVAVLKSSPTAPHVPAAFTWNVSSSFRRYAQDRSSVVLPAHSLPATILRI